MKIVMPVLFLFLFSHALAARQQGSSPPQPPSAGQETSTPQNKAEQAAVQEGNPAVAEDCGCKPNDAFLGLCRVACEKQKEWDKREDALRAVSDKQLICTGPHEVQDRRFTIDAASASLSAMSKAYRVYYESKIKYSQKAVEDSRKLAETENLLSTQARAQLEGAEKDLQDDQAKFQQLMADPDDTGARARALAKLKEIIDSDQRIISTAENTLSKSATGAVYAKTIIENTERLQELVGKYQTIKAAESLLYGAEYDSQQLRILVDCPDDVPPPPPTRR